MLAEKSIKTIDLFDCDIDYISDLFNSLYTWEILPCIKTHINKLLKEGLPGFTFLKEGVLVGENVKISPLATIEPPAIIGHNTEIRPGCYIRGNVITGPNCVLGNSSELKNCILLSHVQVPHYNYIGDSILGNNAHLGAGAICSNLKQDKKNIVVHYDNDYDTGLRKMGAIIGDNSEIGCNCVLNPGTIIGKNTYTYPLVSLRGVYPSNSIIKSQETVVDKK